MDAVSFNPRTSLLWLVWLLGFSCCAQAQMDTKAVEQRLASTIIPDVNFHDTSISDAIEKIRSEFRQRDTEHQGLSVFLKLPSKGIVSSEPASTPTPTSPAPQTHINLDMHNVSVLDALRGVAAQLGLRVKIEQYAVAIVPLSESTEQLLTVSLKITPEFIASTGGPTKIAADDKAIDAKSWLESEGMTFPPGASAVYFPRTRKLVIRNTQTNLDLVGDVPRFKEKPSHRHQ